MNAPITVPAVHEPIAVIRTQDDLIEAFRKIKDVLGLSNKDCDELGNMVHGHTDKMLGPTRVKNIGPHTFGVLCWLFAVKFEMSIDLDQAQVMAEHWADRQRILSNVRRDSGRVSKQLLERAKPLIMKAAVKHANAVRQSKLTPELRSKIARKAGKARMRKVSKAERSAMSLKGWETRKRAKALVVINEP